MKYLYLSVLLCTIAGCAKQSKVVQLETSRVVPLNGTAILFHNRDVKDKQ